MRQVEILKEIVAIYKKYFDVVVKMGTITMSPDDKTRLATLEAELAELEN